MRRRSTGDQKGNTTRDGENGLTSSKANFYCHALKPVTSPRHHVTKNYKMSQKEGESTVLSQVD